MTDTFFTMCTAVPSVLGELGPIARRSIASWQALNPAPEIILLGDGEGIAELTAEFSVKHLPMVGRNNFGTPLLGSALHALRNNSSNALAVFTHCDVIFDQSLADALMISSSTFPQFLLKGGREGATHKFDYFAFHGNPWASYIPHFALGKGEYDHWLVGEALHNGFMVIDGTQRVKVLHQSHSYLHTLWGSAERLASSVEVRMNNEIMCGGKFFRLREAFTHRLTASGMEQISDELYQRNVGEFQTFAKLRPQIIMGLSQHFQSQLLYALSLGKADLAWHKLLKIERTTPAFPGLALLRALCLEGSGRDVEAKEAANVLIDDPVYGQAARNLISSLGLPNPRVQSTNQ